MDNKDLKYLKKHYGEKFAHLCRELFPTLLETEGLLSSLISKHFGQSRALYNDVLPYKDEFKSYIFSLVDVEKEKPEELVIKTPEELLDEAGYILYPECQTEDEVQSFKKYYANGEQLCTFRGGRLDSCRVWFAVKKNVDQIKREDFKSPTRQDEYGTSVISIQFSKGKNSTLSIKNRYNHRVNNPDATFSNNLDNIISGLTQSFVKTYGISLVNSGNDFELPYYRMGDDGKFYKVNVEIDDVCYCANNIILDHGHVEQIDPARYILAENYLIDRQKNKIVAFNSDQKAFIESFGDITKIETKTDADGNKVVVFTPKDGDQIELTLNEFNAIIGLDNPNVTIVGDDFLNKNHSLTKLSLANVTSIGKNFLYWNEVLTEFYAPNVEHLGDNCLVANKSLTNLHLSKVKDIGRSFLSWNKVLTEFYAPNVEHLGSDCLYFNESLTNLHLPKVKDIGDDFLFCNKVLTEFYAPNVDLGIDCLHDHPERQNLLSKMNNSESEI